MRVLFIKAALFASLFALALPPPTLAQAAPNFVETGATSLSVTTTSSSVALPSSAPTLVLTNTGSVTVYYALAASAATCTATTSSWPIPASQVRELATAGSGSYVCAITASSTATLTVETGTGWLEVAKLNTGGSGSGTVTSITAGTGLTGGTITTSGTIALDLTHVNTWTGAQSLPTGSTIVGYLPLTGGTLSGALTLGGITGSTQCLHVNTSGLISGTGSDCGSGGGGVSSFSGDGTFLSNSSSTGAVTATLATAAQNSVWAGPNSGGTGAPSYRAITATDVTAALASPPAIGGTTPAAGSFAALSSTGVDSNSNYRTETGTTTPTMATGTYAWGGLATAPTLATSEAYTGVSASRGNVVSGYGSTADVTLQNHSGNAALEVLSGTANVALFGSIIYNTTLCSSVAPTITSGFYSGGSTATVVTYNNGTCAFLITDGNTGGTANATGVIGLPTAAHGWKCTANDQTEPQTVDALQTAASTTSCTLSAFTLAGVASTFPANDVITVSAVGY